MSRALIGTLTCILLLGGIFAGLRATTGTAQDVELQRQRDQGPERAASYINPDTGAATFNPDVNPDSECRSPDQKDRQTVTPVGTTKNNVHNDACLFRNNKRFDAAVSFEIKGIGRFSACPDPDRGGPKTAVVVDDGKRCYQTGYQETGGTVAGDLEYHARLIATSPGTSRVKFCHDPNDNGCKDARVEDRIEVTWVN